MKLIVSTAAVMASLITASVDAGWIDIFNTNRSTDLTVMDTSYSNSYTEAGFWLNELEVTEQESVQVSGMLSGIGFNSIGFDSGVFSDIPWNGNGAVNNASSSLSANVELFETATALIEWEFDLESTSFGSALAEISISSVRGGDVFSMSEIDDTSGSQQIDLNPGVYLVQMFIQSEVTDGKGRGIPASASVVGFGGITFVPAPGALALIGLGMMGRSRRRRR
ncbi:MAG: hypothetical protein P8I74_07865 [Phycisphaerales bacterium]|nr:hypothetical protein [Phycisphaerales bacterium]